MVWPRRLLVLAFLAGGAVLGLIIRGMVVLVHAARTAWAPAAAVGALVALLVWLIWRYAEPIVSRARLSKGSLRLGGVGVEVTLDPDSREQLWRFFIQMASRIATQALAPEDGVLEEALTSFYSLFDRARSDLAAYPPRRPVPAGTVPPHVYVLDILNKDLRPCTARWHVRLEAWKRTGRPEAEWPLRDACRHDIERTRQRILERTWQLGEVLQISDLYQLLPARPVSPVPNLLASADLQAAEAGAGPPENAESLRAGWHIYVEAATRIATQELPAGAGLLSEAIASLYTLTGNIRAELRAIPPSPALGDSEGVAELGIRLLNEGLRPFLAVWHPRFEVFKASGAPETQWADAEACRTALSETRERCIGIVNALGRKIGATPVL